MEKKQCDKQIKRILSKPEFIIVKACFDMMTNTFPDTSLIAELKSKCKCSYAFSYGSNYYCCNEIRINELIKNEHV